MRKMKIMELWKINTMINETIAHMEGISIAEIMRIKLENNPVMILLRRAVGEKIMVNDEATATIAYHRNLMGNLFVKPSHQGKGIGTKMLEECEKEIGKKYDKIKIYSYKKAVPLHEKRGYYVANEKNLLMVKNL